MRELCTAWNPQAHPVPHFVLVHERRQVAERTTRLWRFVPPIVLSPVLLAPTTTIAQSDLPPIPAECNAFLMERVQAGADLMRLLALPAVPGAMSDADWQECRNIALAHIGAAYETHKEKQQAGMRLWREEMERKRVAAQRVVDQCRAGGGTWLRSKNRCYTQAESDRKWREVYGE